MPKVNICFDLDGTLLNSKERLYRLFVFLVPELDISFDQYWIYKRSKISNLEIIKKYGLPIDSSIFETSWMNLIESEKYLNYDFLFEGVTALLNELRNKFDLFLITDRQSVTNTISQIKKLNIFHMFREIFITEQKKKKQELLTQKKIFTNNDLLVGDTGVDILAAKELGMKSLAVCSGFRSEEVLAEYKPDYIYPGVSSINFQEFIQE